MPPFAVIAHRGNSALAPENTFSAFDKALESVCTFETDTQLSSDGVAVVLHDEQLGRVNNGSGPACEATWDAMSVLEAGAWFGTEFNGCRIPKLQELLERYRHRAHIHLELKSKQGGLAKAVADELAATGWLLDLEKAHCNNTAALSPFDSLTCLPGLTITSFHINQLKLSKELLPGVVHGWLVQEINQEVIKEAQAADITQLCPRANACTPDAVETARAAGFETVRGWGIQSMELLMHAVNCGMDGATVNWPHAAIEALAEKPSVHAKE